MHLSGGGPQAQQQYQQGGNAGYNAPQGAYQQPQPQYAGNYPQQAGPGGAGFAAGGIPQQEYQNGNAAGKDMGAFFGEVRTESTLCFWFSQLTFIRPSDCLG